MQVTNVYELSTPSFKKVLKSKGIKLLHDMKILVRVTPVLNKTLTKTDHWCVSVYIPSSKNMFMCEFPRGNRKPSLKAVKECVQVILNPYLSKKFRKPSSAEELLNPLSFQKLPFIYIGEKRVAIMHFNSIPKDAMYDDIYRLLTVNPIKNTVYGFD